MKQWQTREHQREIEKRWIAAHPFRSIIKHARARAREKGLEFTLTETDLQLPNVCPVLGIAISSHLSRDHWPSLDRVNNAVGYIPSNVIVISYKANRAKSNLNVEEMQRLAAFFTQLQKETA